MAVWDVLCLCALFFLSCSCQECSKTISVQVTSNGSLLLPVVNRVILWTNEAESSWTAGSNDMPFVSRTYIVNSTNESDWFALRFGQTTYNITLDFDEYVVSCRNLTLHVQSVSGTFTCIPISSCADNRDENIASIKWKKAYYLNNDTYNDEDYDELFAGSYRSPVDLKGLPNDVPDTDQISFSNETVESRVIVNATLSLENTTARSAGHYIAVDGATDLKLYQFTVYYGPILQSGLSTESVKATLGTDHFDEIHCIFHSFPATRVTWTLNDEPVNEMNVMFSNLSISGNVTMSEDIFDYSLSLNGGLMITEVQYDNSGVYVCSGSNGFDTVTLSKRLRVRSPLRPLWPILGIIASFVVTAVFIFGGFVVDKIRGEKTTIDQNEMDEAFRPLSVNSFNEDDGKEPYRRTSSAKELLPKEPTS